MNESTPDWVAPDSESLHDMLSDIEVSQDDVQATLAAELPPQATYQTNPDESPINLSVVKFEEKTDESGRLMPARVMITVNGLATARVKNQDERFRFTFRISPNKAKKKQYDTQNGKAVWTGEFSEDDDLPTRLYAQCVQAYRFTTGEYPKKVTDLVDFLQSSPFRVRNYNTPDGKSLVIQVSSVKRG